MNKYGRNILSGLLGVTLLVTPLVYFSYVNGIFILFYLLCVAICCLPLLRPSKTIKITTIDIAVIVYLLYSLSNLLLIRSTPPDIITTSRWVVFILFYIALRNSDKKEMIVWGLVISGVMQVAIGVAQLCGIMMSYHSDFPVTGTFPNPGPYSGFLALSLVSSVWLILNTYRFKSLLWSMLIVMVFMLLMTDSRAAFVAAIIGIVIQLKIFRKRWIKTISIFVVCFLLVTLYFYRPGSANARLLIWRVCAEMFEKKPLVGSGIGTLSQYYMNTQADFFLNKSNLDFIEVSNNNYQSFNEFIHLAVEQGIVGVLLFLIIITTCRKSTLFPLIVVWCIFSLFSYSADIPALMMSLIGAISLCEDKIIFQFNFNKKWFLAFALLVPFVITIDLKYKTAMKNIANETSAQFPYNRDYMLKFVMQKQTIERIKQFTINIGSSSEIMCDMGDLFLEEGDIGRADSCYVLANRMVPCRIIPLHKLLLLHKDKEKANYYAKEILNFNYQSVGSALLRARADAKKQFKQ